MLLVFFTVYHAQPSPQKQAGGFTKSRGEPTRCATSCPAQVKWLQIRLRCIAGFDTQVEALPGRQLATEEERQWR